MGSLPVVVVVVVVVEPTIILSTKLHSGLLHIYIYCRGIDQIIHRNPFGKYKVYGIVYV